jgi:hypothetical protein
MDTDFLVVKDRKPMPNILLFRDVEVINLIGPG